ncbi:MAG: hypothetical protein CVT99_02135 [Bacteroidetes bacterium HGW-Bacteroidetes-16]|jgi:hypothetical protein|nr:MAG: hypothetical protein CVT99_02135 [Bacteroidetes bacterium HGW-Bacteroidetes-16]
MNSNNLVVMTRTEVKNLFLEIISESEAKKFKSVSLTKTLSFNQARILLGVSHTTVKNLVKNKILKTTSDQRRIPEQAINEYLQIIYLRKD